jgi:hypothetical protein
MIHRPTMTAAMLPHLVGGTKACVSRQGWRPMPLNAKIMDTPAYERHDIFACRHFRCLPNSSGTKAYRVIVPWPCVRRSLVHALPSCPIPATSHSRACCKKRGKRWHKTSTLLPFTHYILGRTSSSGSSPSDSNLRGSHGRITLMLCAWPPCRHRASGASTRIIRMAKISKRIVLRQVTPLPLFTLHLEFHGAFAHTDHPWKTSRQG